MFATPGRLPPASLPTRPQVLGLPIKTAAIGIAASEDGRFEAGMGIDAADLDGDGWQDIYITHLDFESLP
jgi:hypothetical protein